MTSIICNFCGRKFLDYSAQHEHRKACPVELEFYNNPPQRRHVPIRRVRNMVGEIVYATQWKKKLESTEIYEMLAETGYKVHPEVLALCSTFIVWLGTNKGMSLIEMAKAMHSREEGRSSLSICFLYIWTGMNCSMEMLEHLLTPDNGQRREMSIRDVVNLNALVKWLGTESGVAFRARCEKLIYAKDKGLTDADIEALGI